MREYVHLVTTLLHWEEKRGSWVTFDSWMWSSSETVVMIVGNPLSVNRRLRLFVSRVLSQVIPKSTSLSHRFSNRRLLTHRS